MMTYAKGLGALGFANFINYLIFTEGAFFIMSFV